MLYLLSKFLCRDTVVSSTTYSQNIVIWFQSWLESNWLRLHLLWGQNWYLSLYSLHCLKQCVYSSKSSQSHQCLSFLYVPWRFIYSHIDFKHTGFLSNPHLCNFYPNQTNEVQSRTISLFILWVLCNALCWCVAYCVWIYVYWKVSFYVRRSICKLHTNDRVLLFLC